MLEDLELGHNSLKSLGGADDGNGSSALYPLRSLKCLNLTHNELREFSLASLRGLRELKLLDLSDNHIARLHRGRPSSEVGICVIRCFTYRRTSSLKLFMLSDLMIGRNLFVMPVEFSGGGGRGDRGQHYPGPASSAQRTAQLGRFPVPGHEGAAEAQS